MTVNLSKIKLRLSFLMFMQFVIWGAWYVTLGNYLLNTLGLSGTEVGLAYGTTAIAAIVTPFFAGRLADQWFSIERMLFFLHFTGGLVMLVLSFIESFGAFYPLLLVYTFLYLPTFALTSSLAFRFTEDSTKDFTQIRVWGAIGWIVIGFVVGGLELEYSNVPMRISAGASLLQAFYCLTLPKAPPLPAVAQKSIFSKELIDILAKPSFIILIIGLTLTCIPSAFYYSFTNAFLNEVGIANAAGLMSFGQISEIVFMLLLPYFLLRMSIKKILLLGTLCWGIRYLLFAIDATGQYGYPLYIGVLLHGIAFNFTLLLGQIYTDRAVPAHLRSTAQGLITQITLGFGVLIGSLIAGSVVTNSILPDGSRDWESIWYLPGGIGLATTLFIFLFFHEEKAKKPTSS